jgi:hydrogenase maturation protein HypF
LRRSRGYAPAPIKLPRECPCPILAVGGQLKGTFALASGRQAFLSHHLGDLDHFESYRAFVRDVDLYEQLFRIVPRRLVCDAHPDYASTRYAQERAARQGIQLLTVQHHHAHMASCMAEHGLARPVIGVTFDGTGLGSDGAIWGGEFLVGDYRGFRRAAHFRYVGMPGSERAIREPWRMALAHLLDAGVSDRLLAARISPVELCTVERMLHRRFNTPPTSSAGRLFDAVASLAGVRDCVSYEGEAAAELEALATSLPHDVAYPFSLCRAAESAASTPTGEQRPEAHATYIVDTRPLVLAAAEDVQRGLEASRIARRFHSTMVEIIAAVCDLIRQQTGLSEVVLSGGVFANALLTGAVNDRLMGKGLRVYRHQLVPPGDGGLCLGQLAVAAGG